MDASYDATSEAGRSPTEANHAARKLGATSLSNLRLFIDVYCSSVQQS